jgi:hypothetical protein
MVGPVRSNAPVRSQTHTSAWEAIIDSSRSRTGSPRALNLGASRPAVSAVRDCSDSGGQHCGASPMKSSCFDTHLA